MMLLHSNRQTGFSISVVIIALLAVAVIAGAGYVVFNNRDQRNSADATSNLSPTTPKAADQNPAPASTAAEAASLKVKEWGMTISLPEDVKDAYYVVSTSSADSDGSPNTIWIGLRSLPTCAAENGNIGKKPLASITRSAPDYREPVSGELYADTHPDGTTIGQYYYAYSTWDIESNSCTARENLQKVDDAFKAAIKTARNSATTE